MTRLFKLVAISSLAVFAACSGDQTTTVNDTYEVEAPDTSINTDVSGGDQSSDNLTDTGAQLSCEDSCIFQITPAAGSWTEDFEPVLDCACDGTDSQCHALYVSRVVSAEGNTVSMEFKKAGGDPAPTVDIHYWIITSAQEPDCSMLEVYAVRTEGIWPANSDVLNVDVQVWPDEASCNAAEEGTEQALFLITGGSASPDTKTWFQKNRIIFTRECHSNL